MIACRSFTLLQLWVFIWLLTPSFQLWCVQNAAKVRVVKLPQIVLRKELCQLKLHLFCFKQFCFVCVCLPAALWKRILKEKFRDAGLGNGMKLRKLNSIRIGFCGGTMLQTMMILFGSWVLPGLLIQRFESEQQQFKLDTVSKGKLMEHIKNAS